MELLTLDWPAENLIDSKTRCFVLGFRFWLGCTKCFDRFGLWRFSNRTRSPNRTQNQNINRVYFQVRCGFLKSNPPTYAMTIQKLIFWFQILYESGREMIAISQISTFLNKVDFQQHTKKTESSSLPCLQIRVFETCHLIYIYIFIFLHTK